MWISRAVLVALLSLSLTYGLSRRRRQATCSSDTSCIPLRDCEPLLNLLRNPSREDIRKLQKETCVLDRRNPQVCCPNAAITTSPPKTTDPPNPTGSPQVQLPTSCGHSNVQNKVVGGKDVTLGEYPWMAALGYLENGVLDWRCGGALINERYVITAAHCTYGEFNGFSRIDTVRLGEHNLFLSKDCETNLLGETCADPVVDIKVESVIVHPDFDKRVTVSDDIALVRLSRSVKFTAWIQPVCIPSAGFDVETRARGSKNVIVAGWGNNEQGRQNVVLQKVDIPFVEKKDCQPKWSPYKLTQEQICFGGVDGKDSCGGDSGGPLILPRSRNSPPFDVIGVVSFGSHRCGDPNKPAVYTSVAAYRSWILSSLRP